MTTTSALLVLPVAAPLVVAGFLLLFPRARTLHRVCGFAVAAVVLAVAGVLLAATADGSVVAQNLGGWPAGVSVVLAADALSSLMLAVTAVLVLACLAFAAAAGEDTDRLFVPLVLVLTTGVYGAYLTADLFNLFVFVEVMLLPSYALLAAGGGPARLAAARLYVTTNLLASTVFLAGLGLLYGTAGTVNLGQLAGTGAGSSAVAAATGVVLLAMAVKAAVVPLHGWLPRTYPHAPPAVTALFSGLLTKVGVYAIFRVYAVVYAGDPRWLWLIMAAALLTMVVGVLGAVGEKGLRPILVFHMASQIGYILLGLAVFTVAGLAAAIFFMVQYVLVKAALLICAGAVEHTYGTGELSLLGGVARQPMLATAFALAALSLAGIPPLSGFVAKLALVSAAAGAGQYLAAAVAVVVSLFTLTSMLKVWNGVFWSDPPEPVEEPDRDRPEPEDTGRSTTRSRPRVRRALAAPALALSLLGVVLGVGAQPVLGVAGTAAAGLTDPSAYVAAVSP
ncbi:MAG: monovalent cation/H+ antiporter subunit D family protein [Pseudonocardia sediminis]